MTRAGRWAALVAVLSLVAAAAPAYAFTISPPGTTIQGGQDFSASIAGLPVAADGGPACLEVLGGNPSNNTISVSFNPICGQQSGWSSTMSIITIPGTPAGTYQIVVEDCAAPSCDFRTQAGNVGNQAPIESQTWTLNVTPGLPIEATTAPPTAASSPAGTQPPTNQSPASQPSTAPKPARTAPSASKAPAQPAPALTAASPTPVSVPPTTPGASTPPGGSQQALAGALVLNKSSVAPGGTVGVSGSGCTPGGPVTVDADARVTATATADGQGSFQARLTFPSSFGTGRYDLVARCGPELSTVVDVTSSSHTALDIVLIVIGLAVAFGIGLSINRLLALRKSGPRS